jgi:uncharacterized protein YdaU (DUF1376 family)
MKSGETVVNSGELNRGGAELETSATTPDLSVTGGNELATPKSTKSPAFQFYARDFLADQEQALMSLQEAGAYIRLLAHCWLKGSLPPSTVELSRLCGATPGQMVKMWPAISSCFKEASDGRWTHKRLDDERKKQADHSRRQSDRADKRWEKSRNATALPRHSRTDALQSSSSSASASTPSEERRSIARTAPLHDTSHKGHAHCGRVCLPAGKFSEFVRRRGGPDPDAVIRSWAMDVEREWGPGGAKSHLEPGPIFQFWEARYSERWPAAKASAEDAMWEAAARGRSRQ